MTLNLKSVKNDTITTLAAIGGIALAVGVYRLVKHAKAKKHTIGTDDGASASNGDARVQKRPLFENSRNRMRYTDQPQDFGNTLSEEPTDECCGDCCAEACER